MSLVEIIYQVNGLPLHVLLIHLIVILIPVTALSVILASLWPVARRRLGIVTALMGAVLIVLVPVTMSSGQWLKDRVASTPLIETHAALGGAIWPWTLSLGILAVATWLWHFLLGRSAHGAGPTLGVRRVVAGVLVILALGLGGTATYQTVIVGESGTRAVWQNSFSEEPVTP